MAAAQTPTSAPAPTTTAPACYTGPIELTVLNPDGTLADSVGVGVFGATWHSKTGENPPPRLKDHRTDARGHFSLTEVRECMAPTFFYAFDEKRELAGFVFIRHLTELAKPQTLRLQPARWITGRIVSTELQKSGHPLLWAAARLCPNPNSPRFLTYFPPSSVSNQFRFLLPPGEYWLDLQGERLEWKPNAFIQIRVPEKPSTKEGAPQETAPHELGAFDLPLSQLARLDGKPAPEWNVIGWSDGQPHTLASLRGRAVLLVFWEKFRPDDSLKEIFELYRRHGGEKLALLVIHPPEPGGLAEIQRILNQARDANVLPPGLEPDLNRWPFPIAIDQPAPAAPASSVGLSQRPYGPCGYPLFILIDAEGKVAGSSAFQEPDFEALLTSLKKR